MLEEEEEVPKACILAELLCESPGEALTVVERVRRVEARTKVRGRCRSDTAAAQGRRSWTGLGGHAATVPCDL